MGGREEKKNGTVDRGGSESSTGTHLKSRKRPQRACAAEITVTTGSLVVWARPQYTCSTGLPPPFLSQYFFPLYLHLFSFLLLRWGSRESMEAKSFFKFISIETRHENRVTN